MTTNKQRKREERQRQKELRRRHRQEAERRREQAKRRHQPQLPDVRPILDLDRRNRLNARQLAMMAIVGAVLGASERDSQH